MRLIVSRLRPLTLRRQTGSRSGRAVPVCWPFVCSRACLTTTSTQTTNNLTIHHHRTHELFSSYSSRSLLYPLTQALSVAADEQDDQHQRQSSQNGADRALDADALARVWLQV